MMLKKLATSWWGENELLFYLHTWQFVGKSEIMKMDVIVVFFLKGFIFTVQYNELKSNKSRFCRLFKGVCNFSYKDWSFPSKEVCSNFKWHEPCPFEFGLRKFALDPVVENFFKSCQKNYKCWIKCISKKITTTGSANTCNFFRN